MSPVTKQSLNKEDKDDEDYTKLVQRCVDDTVRMIDMCVLSEIDASEREPDMMHVMRMVMDHAVAQQMIPRDRHSFILYTPEGRRCCIVPPTTPTDAELRFVAKHIGLETDLSSQKKFIIFIRASFVAEEAQIGLCDVRN
jgi:hypothetical protein